MSEKFDIKKVCQALAICITGECHSDCPYFESCFEKKPVSSAVMDALTLLQEQIPCLPVCEKCGKQIDSIRTSVFNYDGTDSECSIPIEYDEETKCVYFRTTRNWTGYELTDEERKESIRCPHCGAYPFDEDVGVEFDEPVHVLMWNYNRGGGKKR